MIENMEDFKGILSKLPGIFVAEDKDGFILKHKWSEKSWKVEKNIIENIIKNLKEKNVKDETVLYDEYSYEALIKFEISRPIPLRIFYDENRMFKEDIANGITYELSRPTDGYLLFILKVLGESGSLRGFLRPVGVMRRKTNELNFFEFLSEIIAPRLYTLKIKSCDPMSVGRFSDLATAFLFNLSYNMDVAIIEVRFLHELTRYGFRRMKRSRPDEIEPPRRKYIPDLVYHYQMALSTDSIPLQFLSFYHIIEHFFHDVYHEELLNKIKAKLTSPDFSYKRKRDLESLVKLISQKIKYRGEDLSYDEKEALYLTLKRYVRLDSLIERLKEFDEQLIEYYKREKVPFSQGSTVNFTLNNAGEVFRQLADRIYKTRNSIVHSKESGKPRYIPFRDDKGLLMEIPLMRFISEEIIINTSEIIQ
ncbi:hypothetical protein [Thermococcus sibiricus]|nr:hypothetical protein [Thermococcus sibiricus]